MTRRMKLGLAVLIAVPMLALAGVQGYHWFRVWRAHQLAGEALAALEAKDYATASERARAAYYLRPDDLDIVRMTARVAGAGNPVRGLEFWQIAAGLSDDAPEDLLEAGRSALAAGQPEAVEAILLQMEAASPGDARTVSLRSDWLAAQERFIEAADAAGEALQKAPAPSWDDHRRFVSYSLRAGRRQIASQHLRELGAQDTATGLDALRLLAQFPQPTQEELDYQAGRLTTHPQAGRPERLAALLADEALGRLTPPQVADHAAALYALHIDEDLHEFASWLVQRGLAEEVSRFLPQTRAETRRDLFLVWADAQSIQGHWKYLGQVLENPRLPLEESLRQLFRMRAFLERGNKTMANLAWDNALASAARSPAQMGMLAEYALKLGMDDHARAALWRLADDPTVARSAYDQLLLLEQRKDNTEGLRKVLKAVVEAMPANDAARSDLAYIDALLQRDLARAAADAGSLVERHPDYLPYRISLAMVRMRLDQPEEALAALAPVQVDWLAQRSRWRVVLGWVLVANGDPGQAGTAVRDVDPRTLLPEERALLDLVHQQIEARLASGPATE